MKGRRTVITVTFTYLTGISRRFLRNARLTGSWDDWTDTDMQEIVAADGCPAFTATLTLPDAFAGQWVRWGVRADGPVWSNMWVIPTEVHDLESQLRHRELRLPAAGEPIDTRYYLTNSRRLGGQKVHTAPGAPPDLTFTVWAPNARQVEVVFGRPDRGYMADNEPADIDPTRPVLTLHRADSGLWRSDPVTDFARYTGVPYMFRVTFPDGQVRCRTDIYSRWQYGRGDVDPTVQNWDGQRDTLDGRVSCSVVIDQDVVRSEFEPTTDPPILITDEEFWVSEFTADRPVPTRLEDLVIYELHVGSLGFGRAGTGTLADAIGLLEHLQDLGVNAVELLPLAEFTGSFGWGYGNTHHFTIESSAGGRDKFKHFVRECHRRGIAVILDVVYNHFAGAAERAEWMYDSGADEQNIYYWYEGDPGDPGPHGYLDNGSSGAAPRYYEELVRQLFASSAADLVEEFHIDGFRVDLTEAIHAHNHIEHGPAVDSANVFGQKLLREWNRTLRLIRPSVLLIAEDHSGWPMVTQPADVGGLGFDAVWFAEFYHHLIGDTAWPGETARLLREAGYGDDAPLRLADFADRLWRSQDHTVVYHESHDEAGNHAVERRSWDQFGAEHVERLRSARTITVAVNGAVLWNDTRRYAEARARVTAGLSLLSAGTPMFLMGEEVGAAKTFRYDSRDAGKEDLRGQRAGTGAAMFRFYQDLIGLRRGSRAIRSRQLDIIHVNNGGRVIAFTRRDGNEQVLIVACLNNRPFTNGYIITSSPDRLPSTMWQEVFNSDAEVYGGNNIGNAGASIPAGDGAIELRLPANGILVLRRR